MPFRYTTDAFRRFMVSGSTAPWIQNLKVTLVQAVGLENYENTRSVLVGKYTSLFTQTTHSRLQSAFKLDVHNYIGPFIGSGFVMYNVNGELSDKLLLGAITMVHLYANRVIDIAGVREISTSQLNDYILLRRNEIVFRLFVFFTFTFAVAIALLTFPLHAILFLFKMYALNLFLVIGGLLLVLCMGIVSYYHSFIAPDEDAAKASQALSLVKQISGLSSNFINCFEARDEPSALECIRTASLLVVSLAQLGSFVCGNEKLFSVLRSLAGPLCNTANSAASAFNMVATNFQSRGAGDDIYFAVAPTVPEPAFSQLHSSFVRLIPKNSRDTRSDIVRCVDYDNNLLYLLKLREFHKFVNFDLIGEVETFSTGLLTGEEEPDQHEFKVDVTHLGQWKLLVVHDAATFDFEPRYAFLNQDGTFGCFLHTTLSRHDNLIVMCELEAAPAEFTALQEAYNLYQLLRDLHWLDVPLGHSPYYHAFWHLLDNADDSGSDSELEFQSKGSGETPDLSVPQFSLSEAPRVELELPTPTLAGLAAPSNAQLDQLFASSHSQQLLQSLQEAARVKPANTTPRDATWPERVYDFFTSPRVAAPEPIRVVEFPTLTVRDSGRTFKASVSSVVPFDAFDELTGEKPTEKAPWYRVPINWILLLVFAIPIVALLLYVQTRKKKVDAAKPVEVAVKVASSAKPALIKEARNANDRNLKLFLERGQFHLSKKLLEKVEPLAAKVKTDPSKHFESSRAKKRVKGLLTRLYNGKDVDEVREFVNTKLWNQLPRDLREDVNDALTAAENDRDIDQLRANIADVVWNRFRLTDNQLLKRLDQNHSEDPMLDAFRDPSLSRADQIHYARAYLQEEALFIPKEQRGKFSIHFGKKGQPLDLSTGTEKYVLKPLQFEAKSRNIDTQKLTTKIQKCFVGIHTSDDEKGATESNRLLYGVSVRYNRTGDVAAMVPFHAFETEETVYFASNGESGSVLGTPQRFKGQFRDDFSLVSLPKSFSNKSLSANLFCSVVPPVYGGTVTYIGSLVGPNTTIPCRFVINRLDSGEIVIIHDATTVKGDCGMLLISGDSVLVGTTPKIIGMHHIGNPVGGTAVPGSATANTAMPVNPEALGYLNS